MLCHEDAPPPCPDLGNRDMSGPVTYPEAVRPRRVFPAPRRLLRRPRIALPVAAVVLAGAAAAAWFLTRPAGSAGTVTSIVPVVRTTLSQTLSASGTIGPKKSAALSFSAAGQVTAVEATAGERVVKGQPLASMNSPTLKAQAAQAEASLASAQAQLATDQPAAVRPARNWPPTRRRWMRPSPRWTARTRHCAGPR